MSDLHSSKHILPDIASEQPMLSQTGGLDRVGMSQIETPILLADADGQVYRTPAMAEAYVNLTSPTSRGIHMSRLFKTAQENFATEELSLRLLAKILDQFLASHEGISDFASIGVSFSALLQRKALKSDNFGYRNYPVQFFAEQNRGRVPRFFLEVVVTYSSTCPASAALARQLIQAKFAQDFTPEQVSKNEVHAWLGTTDGILATPHAQRSYGKVKIELNSHSELDYIDLIDLLEDALQTPVQSVVKRDDEQEFALRNGQNLMFCEDAARRVQLLLENTPDVIDYLAELRHVESLHPHDAVARVSKRQVMQF